MKVRYDRKALRRLRSQRGLDVTRLALAAKMSKQNVSLLDLGHAEPRATTLAKLASALDVPIGAFFVEQGAA